jgi:hypothetical protein
MREREERERDVEGTAKARTSAKTCTGNTVNILTIITT